MKGLRKHIIPLALAILQWTCVNSTYDTPAMTCDENGLQANATFGEIKQLFTGQVTRITDDLVIEGYVISSDMTGNFYGTLHLQDRPGHPVEGIQVDIDMRDYHLFYPIGKKVLVRLKGLYLGRSHEVFRVGGVFTNAGGTLSVGRLPASQVRDHVFLSCNAPETVIPKVTAIGELNDEMINTLVQLNGVEVIPGDICEPYAVALESGTDRILRNCRGEEIVLRNSGYAGFQSDILPSGNGRVTAVLGKYNNKYQLTIRDTDDISMDGERCGGIVYVCDPVRADASVAFVREMYGGRPVDITENIRIRATVISDREHENTDVHIAVLQDDTAGIACEFTSGHYLDPGDTVELTLRNTVLREQQGILYIGDIPPENLLSSTPGEQPEPVSVSLTENLSPYESRLVRIAGVQFDAPGQTYSGVRTLTDCTDELSVYTREEAAFAGEHVSGGKGSITGIVSAENGHYGLRIRNLSDVRFTGEYTDCLGGTNLMITEYVEGSGYNKYIEIYNATEVEVDMDGYVLARDFDGDGDYRYTLSLSGTMAPGALKVYAHPRAELYEGEISGTHGTALGFNGDDQVALMKNGMVIDHLGIPGGVNWGMDKTLRRKPGVTKPNVSFDVEEWEEYPQDDVSGLGER